jgi:hypothetical protein
MKPPAQIARFMRSMTLQDPQMKLAFNARRFQYGDTECGMYSLYFHHCCLLEIPMDERIPDDVMNKFRQLLFKVN